VLDAVGEVRPPRIRDEKNKRGPACDFGTNVQSHSLRLGRADRNTLHTAEPARTAPTALPTQARIDREKADRVRPRRVGFFFLAPDYLHETMLTVFF
jgi:hypothetical protein